MEPSATTAAIVLAGGKSTRLGRDKASEPLLGVPLLQRVLDRLEGLVDEYVVVVRAGQVLPPLSAHDVKVVEDLYPETGPLGGIYTGLSAVRALHAVVVACDMPLLQRPLIAELLRLAPGHDAVVPLSDGLPQPLCATYARACLEPARRQLEAGNLKVAGLFDHVRTLYLQPEAWRRFDAGGRSFLNLNREEDLEHAAALLRLESEATKSES
jgi:molybdopterin-guanine dinucleotide biosynthesis protein A